MSEFLRLLKEVYRSLGAADAAAGTHQSDAREGDLRIAVEQLLGYPRGGLPEDELEDLRLLENVLQSRKKVE